MLERLGIAQHDIGHAMAVIEQLGEKTGLWDTTIRTDTEPLTKKKLEFNAKNLNDFDAILMFTGGDLEMDAQQRADFLSFIHDDGKGLIGVHSAAITWVKWPEFVDMLGGDFSHDGEDCTFETLIRRFGIQGKVARKIAEMVHDADLGDDKFQRSECIGIDRVLKGWGREGSSDQEILRRGFQCFDALYTFLQRR